MDPRAAAWFATGTTTSADWPLELVAERRRRTRVSVVIPAHNEQDTIAEVVGCIRAELMGSVPIVDELLVMDSLSDDATAGRARSAGATVHSVADVVPELGVVAGKGEALWKSLFVASGDVLVFVDADLTEWGPHFVTGLLGPLVTDPGVVLVKGFYDRIDDSRDERSTQGGRVTELVARPLLALRWPHLGAVVQPLAGEWAIRRDVFAGLHVPVGYGVEFATLVDVVERHGMDALAQVDLGQRAHRHQSVHDLGVMATEILRTAERRCRPIDDTAPVTLSQYTRAGWRERGVPVAERPPAASTGLTLPAAG